MSTVAETPSFEATEALSPPNAIAAWINRVLLILACLGIFDSGVLSVGHLFHLQVPCGIAAGGCEAVAQSPASSIFGIPVAYMGFVTYLLLAILAVLRMRQQMLGVSKLVLAGFGLSIIGTIFSVYLQYEGFFVIHAWCPWCLTSAVTMIVMLVLHAVLAQTTEGKEARTPMRPLDGYLLIGLPVVLVVGLIFTGASMVDAAKAAPMVTKSIPPEQMKPLLFAGGHSEGPEDAPLTVVEFADLQCPACQSSTPLVAGFQQAHSTKMRIIFHHFPIDQKHPFAVAAAALSEIAAEKGKFWEFTLAEMAPQKEAESPEDLYAVGAQIGLNDAEMRKRMSDPNDKAYLAVRKDLELADRLGLMMTPTFFIFSKGNSTPETAGSNSIMEMLNSDKYARVMNGG